MTPPPPSASPAPASPFDPVELAGHVAWVQRLARALVRDAAAADDVAQETWRVTLAQPAGRVAAGGSRLRAWLGGVARRLAVDRARSERSRAAREQHAMRVAAISGGSAGASAPHEPHEIVERSARQQRVVAAVMQLAEPYRSTVLYRWFDELPTRDVAARMQCSEEAVRKRLERAHAQLRSALDREFGAPTRQWAGLLLAGAGAMAMGGKAKAVVAAGIVVALGATAAWKWHALAKISHAVERSGAAVDAAIVATAPADGDASSEQIVAERRDESPRLDPLPDEFSGTIVPVRVVTRSGEPCVDGMLTGFWDEFPRTMPADLENFAPTVDYRRAIRERITGEITELRLPVRVSAVQLDASVAGSPATARFGFSDAASEADALVGRPHRWRPIELVVGGDAPEPSLRGVITVDGERRTPRGLAIDPTDFEAVPDDFLETYLHGVIMRINAADASYLYAERVKGAFKLWVTSDETAPRLIEVDDDDTVVDLALESGRTLELTVLDRATGRIVPHFELFASVGVVVERGIFRELWRDHSWFQRTGADGVVRLCGLPDEGRIEIRRDDEQRAVAFEPSPKQPGLPQGVMLQLPDPLLSLPLRDDGVDPLRATLRIDVDRPTRRITGTVPPEFLVRGPFDEAPVQLFWAKEAEGEQPQRRDAPIVPDARGDWSLEVPPDTTVLIWGERERWRISEVARIAVASEDVGPVELTPRRGAEVLVRVRRCPAEGWISLSIDDPAAVTPLGAVFASSGGTFERRFVLDRATAVSVEWRRMRGADGGSPQRRVVDPATMSLVEFDLAGEGAREVVVALDRGALPSPAALVLVGVDANGAIELERRAFASLVDGRASEPIALAPGRWLWFVVGEVRGVIAGVALVAPFAAGVPITLRAALEARDPGEIGRGFTLEAVDGVEIPAALRGHLQWVAVGRTADTGPILVPASARIALREE